jgi:arabinofuranan 3-O-arabinosyltransferase
VRTTLLGYRIRVEAAGAPFYLVLGQNASTGWHASIGGRSLGPSLVLDGYSAGWRVSRTGSYTIDVTYAAQSRQDLAFLVSGLTLPVTVGVVVVGWWRSRRRRRSEVPAA